MIKKKLVQEAVNILRDLNKKHYDDCSKKKPLLEAEEQGVLFLQINLKKIPQSTAIKMIKVPLPHSLKKDSDEVCLITGDLDKKNHKAEIEPDILHYKQLLEEHGITCISEVVTLRQLRTDYKPYEAKQKLLAAYDIFLADNKIAGCLPRVLGKHFFKKRKFPIQINMKTSNLKQQIEKALSTKMFSVTGHGNSCCSEIAYLDMKDSEILENVKAMTEMLSTNLPGLWENVMGVYLRTAKSKAIPLYMSYDDPSELQLPEEVKDCPVIDELSTLSNVKIKVFSDGSVKKLRCNEYKEENKNDEDLDLEVNVPKSVKETKSRKTKKGLAEAESDSQNQSKEEFQNLEANVPKSVKKTKKSRKTKKGLTEAGSDSEIKEELQNSEQLNSQELEKETKKSKKKGLTKMQLLPKANDSESESSTANIRKRRNAKDCFTSKENLEQVNSQELGKEAKISKKKKGLAKMQLLPVSNVFESESTAVNKREKTVDCSSGEKKSTKQVNLKAEGKERPKRKRTESKSETAVQTASDNEMQTLKKRKVEGINMKRYNTRKESRKNKKKGNHPKQKI